MLWPSRRDVQSFPLSRGLVGNIVTFDRTSLLVAAGWKEITARMENGRQLGHNFPQPRQFRVLGRVCQPRERHVWTIDETTDLTKCALSLPREIYTVWMWRCGSILMRCLDGRARSFSTRPLKVYSSSSAAVLPSARARSPGQSHLGRDEACARPMQEWCSSVDRFSCSRQSTEASSPLAAPSSLITIAAVLRSPVGPSSFLSSTDQITPNAFLGRSVLSWTTLALAQLIARPFGKRYRLRHATAGSGQWLWYYHLANGEISHYSHASSFRPATRHAALTWRREYPTAHCPASPSEPSFEIVLRRLLLRLLLTLPCDRPATSPIFLRS
jgi:hypothetical protein